MRRLALPAVARSGGDAVRRHGARYDRKKVWDSQQPLEAFGARIMPLLADVALEHSGQREILEVHNIIRR